MAAVDSEAFFDTRMQAIGLSSVEQIAVRAQGWLTLANFASASVWTPGQSGRLYDEDFMDRVIVPVLGDPRHTSGAKLRRLMFEAFTLPVSDLREQVTRTSDDPPQKLPAQERAARMQRIKDRLTGISITNVSEPSHKLVDTYVQMYEDDVLRFVPWNELTERSQEVLDEEWLQNGFTKAKALETDLKANLTSNFRFVFALQWRGLAMEIAGLCQYEVHQAVRRRRPLPQRVHVCNEGNLHREFVSALSRANRTSRSVPLYQGCRDHCLRPQAQCLRLATT